MFMNSFIHMHSYQSKDGWFDISFGYPSLNYGISGYSLLERIVSSVTFTAVLRLYPLASFHRSGEFQ